MFFFFNDTATTEIYTLSLHDALPISSSILNISGDDSDDGETRMHDDRIDEELPEALVPVRCAPEGDRKSTRLNSSHSQISYAVFCLKKKNNWIRHSNHAGTNYS